MVLNALPNQGAAADGDHADWERGRLLGPPLNANTLSRRGRLRLNDDQYLDRLRRLQPVKRFAAYSMLAVGVALAIGIGVWALVQRARIASAFDDLAAMTSPTTWDTVDALQYSRDVSTFSLGATVGMLFAIGLALAFAGAVVVAGRRKDRLLLEYDAAARQAR